MDLEEKKDRRIEGVPKKGSRRAMKEELRGWGIHIESIGWDKGGM